MGTSVISPKIFYLMDVVGELELLCGVGIIVCIILGGCCICCYVDSYGDDNDWIKYAIRLGVMTVVLAVLIVLIPSKDTMLTMLVADMITYENIELTKESAMALINYIVEQVEAITG